jgi:hypothetical protein
LVHRRLDLSRYTTSDFPIILGDTVGRVLRDAYQAAPAGVRRLGRQTTARDFRAVNKLMLGEAPLLEKLNEHGEIKAGTMAEAREAYKVETWARKIGITRQVLVNDDLGAFSDLARRMGQGAAETEARVLVDLLEANTGNGPKLSDNKTLFHADHGNKAPPGATRSWLPAIGASATSRSMAGASPMPRMVRWQRRSPTSIAKSQRLDRHAYRSSRSHHRKEFDP